MPWTYSSGDAQRTLQSHLCRISGCDGPVVGRNTACCRSVVDRCERTSEAVIGPGRPARKEAQSVLVDTDANATWHGQWDDGALGQPSAGDQQPLNVAPSPPGLACCGRSHMSLGLLCSDTLRQHGEVGRQLPSEKTVLLRAGHGCQACPHCWTPLSAIGLSTMGATERLAEARQYRSLLR